MDGVWEYVGHESICAALSCRDLKQISKVLRVIVVANQGVKLPDDFTVIDGSIEQ
tara:strand:- start:587 stop:751 length:165 start_codon:yes stop_codon:yes gene_type:complete